jgi:hypothetical protein
MGRGFSEYRAFDSRWTRRDGLLHKAVKQLAAVPGKTSIETECELVKVRL